MVEAEGVARAPSIGLNVTQCRTISEATIDAPHQAVSFHGYWAINGQSDFKKAAKAMIGFRHVGMRAVDEPDGSTVLGPAARSETVSQGQMIDPSEFSVGPGATREQPALRCCERLRAVVESVLLVRG